MPMPSHNSACHPEVHPSRRKLALSGAEGDLCIPCTSTAARNFSPVLLDTLPIKNAATYGRAILGSYSTFPRPWDIVKSTKVDTSPPTYTLEFCCPERSMRIRLMNPHAQSKDPYVHPCSSPEGPLGGAKLQSGDRLAQRFSAAINGTALKGRGISRAAEPAQKPPAFSRRSNPRPGRARVHSCRKAAAGAGRKCRDNRPRLSSRATPGSLTTALCDRAQRRSRTARR